MKKFLNFKRASIALLAASFSFIGIFKAFAQSQPGLQIANLGTNNFLITVTNGVTSTNYTLFWTPGIEDENLAWQVLAVTGSGQTNFTINAGEWPMGYFTVLLGSDRDGDGSLEPQDAQPLNSSVGILTLTIDNPTNGTNLQ